MITTFIGPMFSGKSDKLIEIYNSIYNKKAIFAFKPYIDTRDDIFIRSRSKTEDILSFAINWFDEIDTIVHNSKDFDGRVILIDEAQFIQGDVKVLLKLSIIEQYDIFISGLNLTTELKPFGSIPNILSISDNIIKLTSTCYYCGKHAEYTKCLVDKKQDIMVGSDEYIPICKDCLYRYWR